MAVHQCKVRALPPVADGDAGTSESVIAQGQYRCPTDGKLVVTLMRAQPRLGWVTAATQTFEAPKSSDWSQPLGPPPVECVRVQYETVVMHTHEQEPGRTDHAKSRPCPSPGA